MTLLSAALALTACNDDDTLRDGGHGHDHDPVETGGRLVIGKADGAASQAVVVDLDDGAVLQRLALRYAPTAVHASPGHRYAVVLQAGDGAVNFIDSGLWLHGDHAHADQPSLLSLERSGSRPAHYRVHDGQAALFYDGEGVNPARFELFTEASLTAGSIEAAQTLPAAGHGIAEPRGHAVLALDYSVEEAAAGAVRSGVAVFERHGDHFHHEGRFATACENLHGGGSIAGYAAFGCTDGVLVIEQQGDVLSDRKILTDRRITQVAGHEDAVVFAAFAGDGTLYVVDPEANTASIYDWNGADADIGRRQHSFDAHGEHLLILDVTGTLHVLELHGDHFHRKGKVQVLEADHTAARIATSAAGHLAFVTDPAGQAVVVVDLETVEISRHIDLDFAPVGVAWTGLPDGGHDHGHAH